MRTDERYDSYIPLKLAEDGDAVTISVGCGNKKHIKPGKYRGIFRGNCVRMRIECAEEPRLNGAYTFWYGQKWGDSNIHAELEEHIKARAMEVESKKCQ